MRFRYKFDTSYLSYSHITVAGIAFDSDKTRVKINGKTTDITNTTGEHYAIMKLEPDVSQSKLQLKNLYIDGKSIVDADAEKAAAEAAGGTYTPVYGNAMVDEISFSSTCESKNLTHYMKDLEIWRGTPDIEAPVIVGDTTAVDLKSGVTVKFNEPVTGLDTADAITLYKGDEKQAATITPASDGVSATVKLDSFNNTRENYEIRIDSTKLTGILGGKLADNVVLPFRTSGSVMIANDNDIAWTNATANVSSDAIKRYSTTTYTDGWKVVQNKAGYEEMKAHFYDKDVADRPYYKKDKVTGELIPTTETPAEGTYDEIMWYYDSNWLRYSSKFSFTSVAADGGDTRPIYLRFTYNLGTGDDVPWRKYLKINNEKTVYIANTHAGNSHEASKTTKLTETANCEHDLVMRFDTVVVDGTPKFELTNLTVDGKVIDTIVKTTEESTVTNYTCASLSNIVMSAPMNSADRTYYLKNLEVWRGAPDIAAPIILGDTTAADLNYGVTVQFEEAVTGLDTPDAITLWKGDEKLNATVTPAADNKSADVTMDGNVPDASYEIRIDSKKLTNNFGGTLYDDVTLPFVTDYAKANPPVLIASDKTTDWTISGQTKETRDYYSTITLTNGLEIVQNKAKYDEFSNKYTYTVARFLSGGSADGEGPNYVVDENGSFIENPTAETIGTHKTWYWNSSHARYTGTFNFSTITPASADKRPVYVMFKYNAGTKGGTAWRRYISIGSKNLIFVDKTLVGPAWNNGTKIAATADGEHDILMKFEKKDISGTPKLELTNLTVDGTVIDTIVKTSEESTVVNYNCDNLSQIGVTFPLLSDDITLYVKDFEVWHGAPNIEDPTIVGDTTSIDPRLGIKVEFKEAVTGLDADDAVTLWKGDVKQEATITPAADNKSVLVKAVNPAFMDSYEIRIDRAKITNTLGGKLADDIVLPFQTCADEFTGDYTTLYVQNGLTYYWDGDVAPDMASNNFNLTGIPSKLDASKKIDKMASGRNFATLADMGKGFTYNAEDKYITKTDNVALDLSSILPLRKIGDADALDDMTFEVVQSYPEGMKSNLDGGGWTQLGFPDRPQLLFGNYGECMIKVPGMVQKNNAGTLIAYSAPLESMTVGGTKLDDPSSKVSALFYNTRELGSLFTTSISYDFSGESVNSLSYALQLARDGKNVASNSGTYVNDAVFTNGKFTDKNLSYGIDAKTRLYSIRMYNRVLTEAEKQQNHFADLAKYFKSDLTELYKLTGAERASIFEAFAGYDTSTINKTKFNTLLDDLVAKKLSATDAKVLVNTVVSPNFASVISFKAYSMDGNGVSAEFNVGDVNNDKVTITEVGALAKPAKKEDIIYAGYANKQGQMVEWSEITEHLTIDSEGATSVKFYENGAKTGTTKCTVSADTTDKNALETDYLFRGYVKYIYEGNEHVAYTDMGTSYRTGISVFDIAAASYSKLSGDAKTVADTIIDTVVISETASIKTAAQNAVTRASEATAKELSSTYSTKMTEYTATMQTKAEAIEASGEDYGAAASAYNEYLAANAGFKDYNMRFIAIDTSAVPDFTEETAKSSASIEKHQKDDSFKFTVFTDVHIYPPNQTTMDALGYTYNTIGAMNKAHDIQANFYLGDTGLAASNENREYWTIERINQAQADIFSNMQSKIGANSFMVAGNHDGLNGAYAKHSDFYNVCVKPLESVSLDYGAKITTVPNKGYYYIDYDKYNVRVLCLMSFFKGETNGTSYAGIDYDKEQLEWIATEALNTDKDILVMAHVPPEVEDGSEGTTHQVVFRQIMTAYADRTAFSGDGIEVDYTDAEGTIVAMFVGHQHHDRIVEWNDFPCPVIELQGMQSRQSISNYEGSTASPAVNGTYTMISWDTVVFNPKTRELNLVRFGGGNDRETAVPSRTSTLPDRLTLKVNKDGKATASRVSYSLTASTLAAWLGIAQYTADGRFIDASFKDITLDSDGTQFDTSLTPKQENGSYFKAFLFDGVTKINPLTTYEQSESIVVTD